MLVSVKTLPCTEVYSYSLVFESSVMDPLLFLLFIDDKTSLHLNSSNLMPYADDLLLYGAITTITDYELLQSNFKVILINTSKWSEENQLKY